MTTSPLSAVSPKSSSSIAVNEAPFEQGIFKETPSVTMVKSARVILSKESALADEYLAQSRKGLLSLSPSDQLSWDTATIGADKHTATLAGQMQAIASGTVRLRSLNVANHALSSALGKQHQGIPEQAELEELDLVKEKLRAELSKQLGQHQQRKDVMLQLAVRKAALSGSQSPADGGNSVAAHLASIERKKQEIADSYEKASRLTSCPTNLKLLESYKRLEEVLQEEIAGAQLTITQQLAAAAQCDQELQRLEQETAEVEAELVALFSTISKLKSECEEVERRRVSIQRYLANTAVAAEKECKRLAEAVADCEAAIRDFQSLLAAKTKADEAVSGRLLEADVARCSARELLQTLEGGLAAAAAVASAHEAREAQLIKLKESQELLGKRRMEALVSIEARAQELRQLSASPEERLPEVSQSAAD